MSATLLRQAEEVRLAGAVDQLRVNAGAMQRVGIPRDEEASRAHRDRVRGITAYPAYLGAAVGAGLDSEALALNPVVLLRLRVMRRVQGRGNALRQAHRRTNPQGMDCGIMRADRAMLVDPIPTQG